MPKLLFIFRYQYSRFLFVIGETRREIFNTFSWNKKIRDGVETEEDDITVKELFQKFEDCGYQRRI